MPRRSHITNLATYLFKNSQFKSFIYDSREIRTIADNLGFKTNRVRIELRKLGYCLIKNNNGRMIWRRDDMRPGSSHATKGHPPTSQEEERWRRRRETLKKYQLMRAAWKP